MSRQPAASFAPHFLLTQRLRPLLVAACGAASVGMASAADYWSSFSGVGAGSWVTTSISGSLHGAPVSIANAGNTFRMLYLNNGVAWANTNAGIYPPSFNITNFEFVRSNDATATVASPGIAHIDFDKPVVDPILIFYSLDASGVTINGTLDTAGAPAVVTIDSNQPSQIDTSTRSVSGPFAGGAGSPEGCITGSRRVCGIYRFTGTYSQLSLGQFGSAGDGVGFQVGVSITPMAVSETFTGTAGTEQMAASNLRSNDSLTGAQGTNVPADATNTSIPAPTGWPSGFTLDPASGAVTIAASVAAGTYTLPYQLCDAADANNCADATVTVELKQVVPPVVTPATPVPTLSQWALLLMSALAALGGGLALRRRPEQ
ncbi:IPTL-CTERM sorting domain-containing protein [Diaphorobacter sp. HDW4A]|uniref:IPTL-CTERM sorting domain-containing protein n=1 Tax=Diaphorobacter sp. HDW4A TaxID=2714924 RepID=UPI00140B7B20|nr:IPTL-CTERM sorting domain-containing protein [Diaphorobacter sp. HDW4A]QIL80035.1 IPTL-CTERM sorting domain-containing protein [Diaphorobacter sp. HDW4A]